MRLCSKVYINNELFIMKWTQTTVSVKYKMITLDLSHYTGICKRAKVLLYCKKRNAYTILQQFCF